MRPRHNDSDLLELAAAGSSPAFASLLHRHREVLQRGALRAEHPEKAVEKALTAAIQDLHHDRIRTDSLRDRLGELMEAAVREDQGRPGVERLLPSDWFDRAWVRVEERWPTGRRRLSVPRWAWRLTGVMVLATAGIVGTVLVVTADVTTDVVSELVADPVEDRGIPEPGPLPAAGEPEPVESPQLFDDVELGELPNYDLTGGGAAGPPSEERSQLPPSATRIDGDDEGAVSAGN